MAGLALATVAVGWAWHAAVIFTLICVAGGILIESDDSKSRMTAVPVPVPDDVDPEADRPGQQSP